MVSSQAETHVNLDRLDATESWVFVRDVITRCVLSVSLNTVYCHNVKAIHVYCQFKSDVSVWYWQCQFQCNLQSVFPRCAPRILPISTRQGKAGFLQSGAAYFSTGRGGAGRSSLISQKMPRREEEERVIRRCPPSCVAAPEMCPPRENCL